MNPDKLHFVVIDDSKLDCFIAEKIIQNTGRSSSVKSFQLATEALEYLTDLTPSEIGKTIILVDIQMPIMNGFEFIEAFEQTMPEGHREQYVLNLLSSSINESDMIKARSYASVNKFLNKPLTSVAIMNVLESAQV